MSPDRIRDLLSKRPFEPFTIFTGDGSEVDVISNEFALLYPGGRTLRVVAPKKKNARTEGDFDDHVIDVFLVTKVTYLARNRRKAG